jgi:hypothetical protein
MATPTVEAVLDRDSYPPGDTITLDVTYADVDNQQITITVVATDSSGNSSEPVSVVAVIADVVTVNVTSDPARNWTQVSDTGAVATFTAVA